MYKQLIGLLLENDVVSKYDIVDKIAMNPEEIEEYCYLNPGTLYENKSRNIITMHFYLLMKIMFLLK